MKIILKEVQVLAVMCFLIVIAGCVELKAGVGPFKAGSIEAGPGGVEVKGPSAGPLKTRSIDKEEYEEKKDKSQ